MTALLCRWQGRPLFLRLFYAQCVGSIACFAVKRNVIAQIVQVFRILDRLQNRHVKKIKPNDVSMVQVAES